MLKTEIQIIDIPNGWDFFFLENGIHALVKNIVEERRSKNLSAEITIRVMSLDTRIHERQELIESVRITLTSASARRNLADLCLYTYIQYDNDLTFLWHDVVECLCRETIRKYRCGEPAIELWTNEEVVEPQYLIHPIVPLNQPTIMFGDPASGKSQLALLLSICIGLPWYENPLGLKAPANSTVPLLLDYETDEAIVRWQLKCLQTGFDLPDIFINYRRCHIPLVDDLEQVQNHIAETKSEIIIIDSLGPACGGDLKDAESAIAFSSALRQLNKTSLILAHTSKDKETRTKSVFGSMFFEALARSIWEIRKVQEHGDDDIDIALFHRKANFSKLSHPLGFKFHFNGNSTTVTAEDARTVGEFLERMNNKTRIIALFKEDASLAVEDIAAMLDLGEATIRTTLNRYKDTFTKLNDGKWGLLVKDGTMA